MILLQNIVGKGGGGHFLCHLVSAGGISQLLVLPKVIRNNYNNILCAAQVQILRPICQLL
jgi:hypothetical protein